MSIIDKIKSIASRNHKKVVEIRRHLHMHPELSFQEKNTGKFIANLLKQHGIKHTKGWVETGVVGIINPEKSNIKSIALRADIDALPIKESNKVKYKSKNLGVMHACGHDVHTASLCGAAMILNEIKDDINGSIKLIFQPGEEKLPGGASLMIKEGVLKNPIPSSIFGQHVHPPLEVGKVGIRPGPYMASADEIFLTIKGKGGHAALPQDCIDPILISAHVLTSLQQIVSRNVDPNIPSVLSFGKITSDGGSTNIIYKEHSGL